MMNDNQYSDQSSPRLGQPASLAWRPFELQRLWTPLKHASFMFAPVDFGEESPDFQLQAVSAGNNPFTHRHLSREWFRRQRVKRQLSPLPRAPWVSLCSFPEPKPVLANGALCAAFTQLPPSSGKTPTDRNSVRLSFGPSRPKGNAKQFETINQSNLTIPETSSATIWLPWKAPIRGG